MPLIHTAAVIWYSGTPTRRPIRSFGCSIPESVLTKMNECRKNLEGKTGKAINRGWPLSLDIRYELMEHSAASNS
jgi:hypothetical protein